MEALAFHSAFQKYIILSSLISEMRDITEIEKETEDKKKTGDIQIADFSLQLIIFFCIETIFTILH